MTVLVMFKRLRNTPVLTAQAIVRIVRAYEARTESEYYRCSEPKYQHKEQLLHSAAMKAILGLVIAKLACIRNANPTMTSEMPSETFNPRCKTRTYIKEQSFIENMVGMNTLSRGCEGIFVEGTPCGFANGAQWGLMGFPFAPIRPHGQTHRIPSTGVPYQRCDPTP